MGRTVQNSTRIDICREGPLGVREQTLVQLLLGRGEVIASDNDRPGRQPEIVRSLQFGTTKHHSVKEDLQLLESCMARVTLFDTVASDGR